MRRILAVVLAVMALATLPPAAARANSPAVQVVETLHEALIGVMKDAERLGYEGRYTVLDPAVRKAFGLALMAEVAAGQHWKNLDAGERSALVAAFSRFTTASYATRFKGYKGERFEVLGEQPARGEAIVVRAQLVRADGEIIALNYLMRPFADGWRIVDVYLKGSISELATRRSEYSSVIGREGLAVLLARIDERITDYAKGRGAE